MRVLGFDEESKKCSAELIHARLTSATATFDVRLPPTSARLAAAFVPGDGGGSDAGASSDVTVILNVYRRPAELLRLQIFNALKNHENLKPTRFEFFSVFYARIPPRKKKVATDF